MPSPVAVSGSLLAVPLKLHVVLVVVQDVSATTAVGALLPAGSVIVTVCVTEAALPHGSVAVRTTEYVPAVSYVCDGFAEVLVLLVEAASPNVHAYLIASPWLSTVPALL